MSLPISFKIGQFGEAQRWLIDNKLLESVSYEWITRILTFEKEEDAVAFYLAFGIPRYETKVESMLKYEENHN